MLKINSHDAANEIEFNQAFKNRLRKILKLLASISQFSRYDN